MARLFNMLLVSVFKSEVLSLHSIRLTTQAADTGSAALAKSMYFPLADKLISKYFKEHKVEAEAGTSVCVCGGGEN